MIAAIIFIGTSNAYGQDNFPDKYKIGTGSYYINDSLTIRESDLFTDYKSDLGLNSSDEMVRTNNQVMEDGTFRSHYVLYNNGIKVQGSMMNVLGNQGIVTRINGFWVGGTNVDTNNLISKDSAISVAITYMGATEYSWQDTTVADSLRKYPTDAQLIIAPKSDSADSLASNYALCYEVQLTSVDPGGTENVFVDAHTGKGFKLQNAWEDEHSVNNGTLWTWYDGYHTDLTTTTCNLCFNYYLNDLNRKIQAVDYSEREYWTAPWAHIKDGNNNWVSDSQKTAATAQWGVERAWDYFANVQGVAGTGTGSKYLFIWLNTPAGAFNGSYPNAGYKLWSLGNNTYDVIGLTEDNNNYTPPNDGYSMAMLGVLGHEYTHGMIEGSSALGSLSEPPNPPTESNALAEGFSDIFGVMIKRYTIGYTGWIEGKHTVDNLRHLDNPHLDSHPAPDIYLEPGYWTTEPHAAGGVLRKWFYLLSEGGNFNGVSVQGIGTQDAARIAFITFKWWLWPNITYPEAAQQLVAETIADWGGRCSNITLQNIYALNAVGLNVPVPYCRFHINGPIVVSTKYHVTEQKSWVVQNGSGTIGSGVLRWSYPANWKARESGDSLIVDQLSDFGSYDPALIKASYTDSAGDVHQDSLWVRFSDVAWTPTDTTSGLQTDFLSYKLPDNGNKLKVYPNPADNIVKIVAPVTCDKATLSIYDVTGRVVEHKKVSGRMFQVNIQQLPAGLYFIKLQDSNHLFTRKLSVTH